MMILISGGEVGGVMVWLPSKKLLKIDPMTSKLKKKLKNCDII